MSLVESLLDAKRPGWRKRRDKQKSPWNLVCKVVGLALALLYWYGLSKGALALNIFIYPEYTAHKDLLELTRLSGLAEFSANLMIFPLGFPALIAGFISGNCLVSLIPAARETMEKEAGDDVRMTLRGANTELFSVGGKYSLLCLVLAVVGILTLKSI
jgi:hypothetical protein